MFPSVTNPSVPMNEQRDTQFPSSSLKELWVDSLKLPSCSMFNFVASINEPWRSYHLLDPNTRFWATHLSKGSLGASPHEPCRQGQVRRVTLGFFGNGRSGPMLSREAKAVTLFSAHNQLARKQNKKQARSLQMTFFHIFNNLINLRSF